jgi:hypothetical protein
MHKSHVYLVLGKYETFSMFNEGSTHLIIIVIRYQTLKLIKEITFVLQTASFFSILLRHLAPLCIIQIVHTIVLVKLLLIR